MDDVQRWKINRPDETIKARRNGRFLYTKILFISWKWQSFQTFKTWRSLEVSKFQNLEGRHFDNLIKLEEKKKNL